MIFLFKFFQVFIGDSFVKYVFHDLSERVSENSFSRIVDWFYFVTEVFWKYLSLHLFSASLYDVSLFRAAVKWKKNVVFTKYYVKNANFCDEVEIESVKDAQPEKKTKLKARC